MIPNEKVLGICLVIEELDIEILSMADRIVGCLASGAFSSKKVDTIMTEFFMLGKYFQRGSLWTYSANLSTSQLQLSLKPIHQ